MSSTVRTTRRYVIVLQDGSLLEDIDIFLEGSSRVTIAYDGDRFEGDLLALESFAKCHGGVAHPVAPPTGYKDTMLAVPMVPERLETPEHVEDWSEDLPTAKSSPEGVSLPVEDPESNPVKGEDQWPPELRVARLGEHTLDGVIPKPSKVDEPGEPRMGFLGSSNQPVLAQGRLNRDADPDGSANPYNANAGPGLSFDVLHVPGLTDQLHAYGRFWCRAPDIPPLPMVLARDLGNCSIGMPRFAGTTIRGRIRPDTGGIDPCIPDHMMWEKYGRLDDGVT